MSVGKSSASSNPAGLSVSPGLSNSPGVARPTPIMGLTNLSNAQRGAPSCMTPQAQNTVNSLSPGGQLQQTHPAVQQALQHPAVAQQILNHPVVQQALAQPQVQQAIQQAQSALGQSGQAGGQLSPLQNQYSQTVFGQPNPGSAAAGPSAQSVTSPQSLFNQYSQTVFGQPNPGSAYTPNFKT